MNQTSLSWRLHPYTAHRLDCASILAGRDGADEVCSCSLDDLLYAEIRKLEEAADRQAALAAEVERLTVALARAHNEGTHATRCAGRIGGVLREIDPNRCDCWRSLVRAVLARPAAPAVAPGAGEPSASA
jgi:hypothetical protein